MIEGQNPFPTTQSNWDERSEGGGYKALLIAFVTAAAMFAGFLYFDPIDKPITTTYAPAASPAETTGAAAQSAPSATAPNMPNSLLPQPPSAPAR